MTIYRQLDAAYPPTNAAQAAALREITGASLFAVYVPGWGDPYRATQDSEIKALIAGGFRILPILVPNASSVESVFTESGAATALAIVRKWLNGLGLAGTAVGVDIEAGWYAADPETAKEFLGEFQLAAKVGGAEMTFIPYCPPGLANEAATLPDASRPENVWVSSWIGEAATSWPGSLATIPGLKNEIFIGPTQRGWQFAGGANVGSGINADRSVVSFDVSSYWTKAAPTYVPPTTPPAPTVTTTPAPTVTTTPAPTAATLPVPPTGVSSSNLVATLKWAASLLDALAGWYAG
jgi:hypothetical protein